MKLPPYITQQQKKEIAFLFKYIRCTLGIEQALIFKKLVLTAAYGIMIMGKIEFEYFFRLLEKHIKNKRNITTFWDIDSNYIDKIFEMPKIIIMNKNQNKLEMEIQKIFTQIENENIKTKYRKIKKSLFNNNITYN